jgi:hypothetical protein
LPPMLFDTCSANCPGVDVFLGNVLIDLIAENAGGERILFELAVDLRASVSLGFNAATSSMTASLTLNSESLQAGEITENRICADESSIRRILGTVAGALSDELTTTIDVLPLPARLVTGPVWWTTLGNIASAAKFPA